MKERPILFNTEMVRAILEGRKTQTRQIVKPNKWAAKYWVETEELINAGTHYAQFNYEITTHKRAERENQFVVQREQILAGTTAQLIAMAKDTLLHQDYASPPIYCPFGQVGDNIWVKESWSTHACFDEIESKYLESKSIHYLADGAIQTGKKRLASQMPRHASRILLEITKIRVERLSEISEEDAIREGCIAEPCDHTRRTCSEIGCYGPKAIGQFKYSWQKKNGKDSWDVDPWVWVIEFKVIDGLLENRDLIRLGG
ncbi:hypothetical protein [Acinetobacter soli]|uniref:hypothetical protein n=1 Tax=Acinetobacter soli TaxID=487316 RepID=UPI00280F5FDB|nr:hypothetical protein [Acinetobacter soli]MDQ8942054.1 hypothetical protein [Acinetobacter soli]